MTGAAFTTTNIQVDGDAVCLNGSPGGDANNCNIYTDKRYVWLNGGPATAYVGDGRYFFAVLQPGGQLDPNDGGAKNLSDTVAAPWSTAVGSGDAYTNREFTVANGVVTYAGTHTFAHNKIRLMPYDDTLNTGGVYILAICSLDDGYPVTPSRCKYDAFKVRSAATPPPAEAVAPGVVKDAAGAFDTTWTWHVEKSVVGRPIVHGNSGTVPFDYRVTVEPTTSQDGNVTVTGQITVTNENEKADGTTAPVVLTDITDRLSDGTECTVDTPDEIVLSTLTTSFSYECLDVSTMAAVTNTVTVTWDEQTLADGRLLAGSSDAPLTYTSEPIVFEQAAIKDACVSVSDTFASDAAVALGKVCLPDVEASPARNSFTYTNGVPVVPNRCVSRSNVAAFVADDTGAVGSDSETVTVCGPVKGLTMGFWQNKNGQALIAGAGVLTDPSTNVSSCRLTGFLRAHAPFRDLSATAGCGTVVAGTKSTSIVTTNVTGYVYSVIKAGNSSGSTMNAMLKAQMLATALDVYLSDVSTAGHSFGLAPGLGSARVDLTQVCTMLPGSTGSSICGGAYQDVSPAFGGSPSATVSQMLAFAGSRSDVGGSTWYEQSKSTQAMAKNAFDAVNNGAAKLVPEPTP